jgi:hypothetical protein
MAKMGKIHLGRPLKIKTRRELLESIRPHQREFLRRDTGDIDENVEPHKPSGPKLITLVAHAPDGASHPASVGSA